MRGLRTTIVTSCPVAARLSAVSQATLSQQVRALEHAIGVKLLERDSRHVRLTGAGSVFLDEARSMLSRAQDALVRTRAADNGPEGELRVGYVKGYERTDLPEMLFDFHERYPGVRLSFLRENVAELYDALRAEEVDLVINLLYDGAELGEIQYQVMRHYPLLAVVPASSPLAWKGSLRMSDLAPTRSWTSTRGREATERARSSLGPSRRRARR